MISAGTGLAVFIGFAGRIVGISLAGSVFENMIQVNLARYAPDLPSSLVAAVINNAGAVWTIVPEVSDLISASPAFPRSHLFHRSSSQHRSTPHIALASAAALTSTIALIPS